MLGAFGAHALHGVLDERALGIWHTAVEYQFWHALALLGAGVLARDAATRALRCAVFAFVIGSVAFSASLYALALGAPNIVGAITPFGGVALILGWLSLGAHVWRDAVVR
ncbi:MAG: DUF423 domain-containing protein [Dokdonella sp.]